MWCLSPVPYALEDGAGDDGIGDYVAELALRLFKGPTPWYHYSRLCSVWVSVHN